MGCSDACPLYPGKRYEDWELDDPSDLDQTARRLGHSVETLVTTDIGALDDEEHAANQRIDTILEEPQNLLPPYCQLARLVSIRGSPSKAGRSSLTPKCVAITR